MQNDSNILLTFNQAIADVLTHKMSSDSGVIVIGEGVTDPGRIFGTTNGLIEEFGPERVIEAQISENATTGICLGMAINGLTPVLVHQRCDFSLYSFDQIINNIAKWSDMFGGQHNFTVIIRMIIGQGWGQAQQHSQNLQATLAHFPNVNVYTPSTPYAIKGSLNSAFETKGLHIFMEHRWCQLITQSIPKDSYNAPEQSVVHMRKGDSITVVTSSHLLLETFRLSNFYSEIGIEIDLYDIRKLPINSYDSIIESAKKTTHLLIIDHDWEFLGLANQIIGKIVQTTKPCFSLDSLSLDNRYSPAAENLANEFFINMDTIFEKINSILGNTQVPSSYAKHIEFKVWDKPDTSTIENLPLI